MNIKSIIYTFLAICFFQLTACKTDKTKEQIPVETKPKVKVPSFKADSAYVYIEKQLSFGTRVPGSTGHKACSDWMVNKFKSFGADVIEQDFVANIYTGEKWNSNNIIAQFNPKHRNRVILSAHWDSRFMAEEDVDPTRKNDPIPGADDAGSGVGVLLEIARIIQANPIDLGIDIILWDAEDQGQRGVQGAEATWCLGSQYWSNNKHKSNYNPMYGINLDMVGAKNPRFGRDDFSMGFAPIVMNKVWKLAKTMGYSDMFTDNKTGPITDDHVFVNQIARIPMIDIINQPDSNRFGPHWHTHNDDISVIDKRSLKVVGQVVTATIYKESDGSIRAFE